MPRVRAITLDLDNTLWEIDPVIRRAEAAMWSWLAVNHPRIQERYSAADALAIREAVTVEHAAMAHDLRFIRKRVLAELAVLSGYDDSLVEPAFAVFDTERNAVELYPDVLPELERLSGRFTLVAVTNGNANLETIGIRHLFHAVVTAVDAGAPKPEPRIFDAAVQKAGVAPESIVHVGDHPEIDVHGARQAGLRTAWINRKGDRWPEHLDPADAEVRDMKELREWLEVAG